MESNIKSNPKTFHYLQKIQKRTREEIQNKYKEKQPSDKLMTTDLINWLRARYNSESIKRSLFSLIENDGRPKLDKNDEDYNKKILRLFIDDMNHIPVLFDKTRINPKYLFDKETFKEIKMLRDIFLGFDDDGSRTMEIDELENMFEENGIETNQEELIDLVFPSYKNQIQRQKIIHQKIQKIKQKFKKK